MEMINQKKKMKIGHNFGSVVLYRLSENHRKLNSTLILLTACSYRLQRECELLSDRVLVWLTDVTTLQEGIILTY